jgi:hypothetical protein
MRQLSFEPLIPLSGWMGLAVAFAAAWIWYASRRPAGVSWLRFVCMLALMLVSSVVPLVILLNPTWREPLPPPPGKPLLTILVDQSASMSAADMTGGKSRFDEAKSLTRQLANRLNRSFEVRVESFAATSAPAEVGDLAGRLPDGEQTDLQSALTSGLSEMRPAGQALVLITDGIHNGPSTTSDLLTVARLAKAAGTPIYARSLGGALSQWDLAISVRTPQAMSFIRQKVPLNVKISHQGLAAETCDVALMRDGRQLDKRTVVLHSDRAAETTFQLTEDEVGVYRYELRVSPLPGEVTQANNVAAYVLEVRDTPVNVLLVEGKPYWDSKFLARTLLADPAVMLQSVVRLGNDRLISRKLSPIPEDPPPPPGSSPAEPEPDTSPPAYRIRNEEWTIRSNPADVLASADDLNQYQIVVLGRDAELFLTDDAVANLRKWISDQGGSLVCARGAPTSRVNQRLAAMLPVQYASGSETQFEVALTEEGRDLAWLTPPDAGSSDAFVGLPALSSQTRTTRLKPAAVVLATTRSPAGAASPAIVFQPYGSGRVVVIEGTGMWRWAFLPPALQAHDETYQTLWHSLVHWLVSNAQIETGAEATLRTDKVTFAAGEPAGATLVLKKPPPESEPPVVELAVEGSPDPSIFTAAPVGEVPGTYRIDFGRLAEGHYRARLVQTQGASDCLALFDVRQIGSERLDLKARPDLVRRIADDSGGGMLAGDAAREIERLFKAHTESSRPQLTRRFTAWDRWWVLAAAFAVWLAAWTTRRAGGLV